MLALLTAFVLSYSGLFISFGLSIKNIFGEQLCVNVDWELMISQKTLQSWTQQLVSHHDRHRWSAFGHLR